MFPVVTDEPIVLGGSSFFFSFSPEESIRRLQTNTAGTHLAFQYDLAVEGIRLAKCAKLARD